MADFNSYVGYTNMIYLLTVADITSNDTVSSYMDIKYAQEAAFLVPIGNINSGTAGDTETITVECATDPAGTEVATSFNYRISGAVGANTWGAKTAATSTGFTIAITDDNKLIWIELDPAAIQADKEDARYVRVKIAPTTSAQMANCVTGVIGCQSPRYKQTTWKSATAAASA